MAVTPVRFGGVESTQLGEVRGLTQAEYNSISDRVAIHSGALVGLPEHSTQLVGDFARRCRGLKRFHSRGLNGELPGSVGAGLRSSRPGRHGNCFK